MVRKTWSQYRLTDEQWAKFKVRKLSGAYKIVNLQDGMCYVGSSKEMMYRWKIHRGELNRGEHYNKYLQEAWDDLGEENFIFICVEECHPDFKYELEQKYLDCTPNKYNIGTDAIAPMKDRHHTDEAKEKLREDKLGEKHWSYGKPLSLEHRTKLSDAQANENSYWYGKNHADETKEKLSILNRGENAPNYGKKATAETRKRRSNSCADKVYEGTSPTGEVFIFTNAGDFAKDHGLSRSKITLCAQGLRSHHKQWKFRQLDDSLLEQFEEPLYLGISPAGERFFFGNVKRFADRHTLSRSVITQVCQGKRIQHKGWKFEFTELYFQSN